MEQKKLSGRPYQVWAIGGTIHSGHETESGAAATVRRANEEAERLGIKGRYELRTR